MKPSAPYVQYFELLEGYNDFAVGKVKQLARVIEEKSLNLSYWTTFNKGAVYQTFVYKTQRTGAKEINDLFEGISKVPQARVVRISAREDMELLQHKDQQAFETYKAYIEMMNQELSKGINGASIDGVAESEASADEIKERSFNTTVVFTREEFSLMIQDRFIPFLMRLNNGNNPYRELENYDITFKPAEVNATNEQTAQPDSIQKKSGDPNAV